MNWMIPAVISVISVSIANIYQKVVMRGKESDPLASSIFFIFFVGCITGVFALIKGFEMPNLIRDWPFYTLSTICYGLGTLCFFHAAKRIEASEIVILSSFGAIVTILLSVLFLHESFTWVQIIGAICILSSILFAQKNTRIIGNVGSIYSILGTTVYGIAVVSDTYILKRYDAVSFVPVISFLPVIFLLMLQPSKIASFSKYLNYSYLKNIVIYSLFYGIQAIAYYVAIQSGANASRMATIIRSEIILTVLLSAYFLQERDRMMTKIFSAILVTIGVILIR